MDELRDLFVEQLKDLHNAEKQLLKALPKMAKAASSTKLRNAFTKHHAQTEKHVERLEQIFEELGERPGRKKCAAMEGLIEEGKELMQEDAAAEVLDAALIAAAQKVEHYEIASYGTLSSFAGVLGYKNVVKILERTLHEERQTDTQLSKLAETEINKKAVSPAQDGEDEEESIATTIRRTAAHMLGL